MIVIFIFASNLEFQLLKLLHDLKTPVQITTVILLSITLYSYRYKIAQNDVQLDGIIIWYLLVLFSYFQFFQHMWRAFSNLGKQVGKGPFTNYVDKILVFFDHLPPCVDIFYGIHVDKKWTFLDYLPKD